MKRGIRQKPIDEIIETIVAIWIMGVLEVGTYRSLDYLIRRILGMEHDNATFFIVMFFLALSFINLGITFYASPKITSELKSFGKKPHNI